MKRISLLFAGLFAAASVFADTGSEFPFMPPWDDASPGITNMSGLLESPAGKHGFVAAKDGHFFANGKRIRFFGVNTAFGANFPTHDDATKVAARMAKFGINCVRFHHMDMLATPGGIWSANLRTLDQGQLDKLDFFIAQLKANGIYADLNLHVSRTYPEMPKWEHAPNFFKGVDTFSPPMLKMQRDYADDLLKHVNPYTGTAYKNEPAVAIIEINNEDGLICEWWSGAFDDMPDPYRGELGALWNQWLNKKYLSAGTLQKGWSAGAEPLGAEMLREGNFANALGSAWHLEHHEGAEADVKTGSPSGSGLCVQVKKPGREGWHVQLTQSKIAILQGKPYTLTFRAASGMNNERKAIAVVVSQAHAPWEVLWSGAVKLTPEWKDYRFTFEPIATDSNARIVFSSMGSTKGEYQFNAVSLRSGGRFGLQEGERLGAMPPFKKSEFSSRPITAQHDWMRFLWETEEGYWTGMERFLKEEIKTHSIIVGTATGFSPPPIQARLDAVDVHAYWQHPRFPHRPWDQEDWTVNNVSMAGVHDGGTLPDMALRRVAGKPYICTEYNAPAPNSYTAETFLLVNAFAALQDWDAVFAFAYSHRHDDWNAGHIPNFFDIDQHPAKLATLPAAVAMFVRGDVMKAVRTTTIPVSQEQALEATRQRGSWWTGEAFGVGKQAWLNTATQIDIGEPIGQTLGVSRERLLEPMTKSVSPLEGGHELTWNSIQSFVTVNSQRSKAFVGQGTGAAVALGDVTVAPPQGWAAITLTAMDGPDFRSPGRILVAAVGDVRNTGMEWKNSEKSSVGRNWGKAPTLARGVETRVSLPVPASRLKAWALDERGQRKREIQAKPGTLGASIELGAQYQTLWYEVEISGTATRTQPEPHPKAR